MNTPESTGDADTRLEEEIAEALGDLDFQEMLETPKMRESVPLSRIQGRTERMHKKGVVVRIQGDEVFVEFGPKSQGVCPLVQFEEAPRAGQEMEFVIERFDAFDNLFVLSREGAVQKANWDALEVGQVVEARCIGMNRGGLEMEIAHHKAFMPAGQVDVRHVPDISIFIGEKFPCKIIDLNPRKDRIVLSRKAALEIERKRQGKKLLEELEEGQIRQATIVSIQPYGAFADLGGVDGMIHISDMSYERIKHPSEVIKEGDEVEVKVLKIEQKKGQKRIGLGMKQTITDPAASTIQELSAGDTVTGKVTSIQNFGAFVEIAPNVEGLIHISELSHKRVPTVEKVLKKDEVVTAKVLSVDEEKKRISLSLKALQERPAKTQGGKGGKGRREETPVDEKFLRDEDPHLKKLKAQLSNRFSDSLKGGLG